MIPCANPPPRSSRPPPQRPFPLTTRNRHSGRQHQLRHRARKGPRCGWGIGFGQKRDRDDGDAAAAAGRACHGDGEICLRVRSRTHEGSAISASAGARILDRFFRIRMSSLNPSSPSAGRSASRFICIRPPGATRRESVRGGELLELVGIPSPRESLEVIPTSSPAGSGSG